MDLDELETMLDERAQAKAECEDTRCDDAAIDGWFAEHGEELASEVRRLRADLAAALERAEKAERERDVAREQAASTNAAANAVFRGADDLRADRDEWKQQHENAVACWYEERDRLVSQRDEARAEVERLRIEVSDWQREAEVWYDGMPWLSKLLAPPQDHG